MTGIIAGEEESGVQLYVFCKKYCRAVLFKALGPVDIEDHVHDIFVRVFRFIARGKVKQPEYLKTLIGTITRREVAKVIRIRTRQRRFLEYDENRDRAPWMAHHFSIESGREMTTNERAKLVTTTLDLLTPQQREILLRFYVEHDPWREIADSMGLTESNFRLRKSRAKARFGVIGKKLMRPSLKRFIANA